MGEFIELSCDYWHLVEEKKQGGQAEFNIPSVLKLKGGVGLPVFRPAFLSLHKID